MKIDEIKQIINGYINESKIIRIQYMDDYYKTTGMPIKISDELVLLIVVNNFRFDGYTILSIAGIKSIEYSESEKFIEQVIKQEGNENNSKLEVNINGWGEFLLDIKNLKKIIALSIQSKDKNYFVGKINNVECKKIILKEIDTCGNWGEHITISIEDIEEIELSSYYLNMLGKYQQQ